MIFRLYDPEKDQKAVHRIWHETGWISSADDEKQLDVFLEANRGLVAEINGEAECLVHLTPGVFRYQSEDLTLSAITAVTTSRIARKQGFARRLTAQRIVEDAAKGALVSMLGIFEQGFYDRSGYGTGFYENWISFDPAQLKLDVRARVPKRLSKEDAASIHHALLKRHRGHGACNLLPQKIVEAELGWNSKGFGLGYCDGPDGELTHFLWASADGEAVRFNLSLTDPIIDSLDANAPWQGVGSDYVVTLGPESEARLGADAGLPTLTATVNAFSRTWIGVQPAGGFAVSGNLSGSPDLLASLDQILRLPQPKWGWDF